MSPQPLFCLNLNCPSRGKVNAGNIHLHSGLDQRFRCTTCQATFASTKGTLFYRLRTDPTTVIRVLALLASGCPLPSIVFAFEIDPRTVTNWRDKAAAHCQQVHETLVESQPRDLGQVQADEIRVRCQKRLVVWMALAIQVSTRLWLGGAVSAHRDKHLIGRLVSAVRSQALQRPILLMTDGLSTYIKAWKRAFCNLIKTGKRGRPAGRAWLQVVIGQVVKRYEKKRVVGVDHRLVQGTWAQFRALSVVGQTMNTAYIERLNATFRQRLAGLVRRGRCLLRREAVLEGGMYLVGSVYNFCTPHESLRLPASTGSGAWRDRTPAMAAGITTEVWSVGDLMGYRVAPPAFVPAKRRGRPPGTSKRKALEGGAK